MNIVQFLLKLHFVKNLKIVKIVNENAFTRAENENEFQHEVTVPMSLENVNEKITRTMRNSNYFKPQKSLITFK